MSCPPKFADLHKSTDDAFSKDFNVDCLNTKITHNYEMGTLGNGKMTSKVDFSTGKSEPKLEVEFKHNMDQYFGMNWKGVTATKTLTSGSDLVKMKMEKGLAGGKVTAKFNQHCGNFSVSKPDLSFDIGKENFTSNLNIIPQSNFKGLSSVNFSTVAKTGPVHTGLKLDYNMAKGSLDHHLKITKACNSLNFTLGLKNINNVELIASKNINKNLNLGFFTGVYTNIHSKSSYDIKSNNWNSDICLEWANGKVGTFDLAKGKTKFNLKDRSFAENCVINVNSALGVTLGWSTTVGGDMFSNSKVGAGLTFNL